jgi:two-component system, NtrC family, sensor kinase
VLAVVVVLLALGIANIASKAHWEAFEDGVLWVLRTEGVVAAEIAPRTAAVEAGLSAGDILLAVDGRPVDTPADVAAALERGQAGTRLRYTVLRLGTQEVFEVSLAPIPRGHLPLYYVLASVGLFALMVGGWVRLRRPADQATLHFLWLCIAFFGVFTFSFSGQLDRLDWVFYWGDAIAMLLLPPLFLHFTLVFPDRPRSWASGAPGARYLPLLYLPAIVLGAIRVLAIGRLESDGPLFGSVIAVLDRLEPLYLSLYMLVGLGVLVRMFPEVRSVTARRQLRWIVWGTALGAGPFAFAYALPYAFGAEPSLPVMFSAVLLGLIPLAYASAIVRYRLLDVEVIIKRGLVYVAALSAIAAMYAVLLRVAGWIFFEDSGQYSHNSVIAMLATLVVVLLARPVKNAIQAGLDRAFYRDRYDYRRALVGFARDLNSDLDLDRMSERLIDRVQETLLVDRMALMLSGEGLGGFSAIRSSGFAGPVPTLSLVSGLGARIGGGHSVALDDPIVARRFPSEEVEFWRGQGVHYFIPCVSKEGPIAVMALGRSASGDPLNSEDMTLLTAVAGQVATALENARLYGQLHLKAVELERLRQFNENILESLDDGLVVLDVDDHVIRWNRGLEQIYGLRRDSAVGRPMHEVFDLSFAETLRRARADRPAGTTLYRVAMETRDETPNRLLVNVTIVPLRAPGQGQPVVTGTIVILQDATTRVRLEEQLQISEKMASIGLLAAGVAHEVNTPLTGISSYTQMLLEGAEPNDPKTRLLEKIERQTFRAARIVNGLLNLSRPGASTGVERGPVDLNAVIGDVLALLEHQFKVGRIQVRRELASPAPVVAGFEFKLQQVFLNLFINARDAMPRGGWLTVRTRVDGDAVVAEVADTGPGIPREDLSRIYDPFFTTKAIGQGTGLGLSITYGIVREHDGAIACDSTPGEGTRFTLTLPRASALTLRSHRAAN